MISCLTVLAWGQRAKREEASERRIIKRGGWAGDARDSKGRRIE